MPHFQARIIVFIHHYDESFDIVGCFFYRPTLEKPTTSPIFRYIKYVSKIRNPKNSNPVLNQFFVFVHVSYSRHYFIRTLQVPDSPIAHRHDRPGGCNQAWQPPSLLSPAHRERLVMAVPYSKTPGTS